MCKSFDVSNRSCGVCYWAKYGLKKNFHRMDDIKKLRNNFKVCYNVKIIFLFLSESENVNSNFPY